MTQKSTEHVARNIPVLYALKAVIGAMIVMPIITLFFQENGLSMQDIFVLQAIFSVTVVLIEIPSGYFSDKLGHRAAIIIGAITSFIGMVIYTLSFGFLGILAAEIVLGIGFAFFSGATSALLYNSLLELKREGEHKKIESRLISIGSFSQAVGGVLGGFLGAMSLRLPFVVEAGIIFFAIPLSLLLITPVTQKVRDASGSIIKDMARIVAYSMHGHKKLKWIIIYAGLIGTSTLVFVWFMQPYWQMVNIPIVWFGVLWAALNVSVGLFTLFANKFEHLLGLRKSLISLVVLVAVAYMILGLYPSMYVIPVILIFYFVRGVQQPILRDYVHRIIDSDIRATVLSVKALVGRLMFVILGPLLGYASDMFSLTTALVISAVTFLVLGAIPLFFLHKHKAL